MLKASLDRCVQYARQVVADFAFDTRLGRRLAQEYQILDDGRRLQGQIRWAGVTAIDGAIVVIDLIQHYGHIWCSQGSYTYLSLGSAPEKKNLE